MAFANRIKRIIDLPHEPGESITIRKLTWLQIEQARAVLGRRARKLLAEEGPAIRAAKEEAARLAKEAKGDDATRVAEPAPEAAPVAQPDTSLLNPIDTCDDETVLRLSIVEWTYPETLTPEAILELDEPTVRVVLDAIRELNAPPTAEQEKNSSGASIER